MTILAQHGWGKSCKIEQGIYNQTIEGLILSPRDENPSNLAAFLNDIQADHPDSERLVDPQFYVGTIWPVRDGNLEKYHHYRRHLDPTSFSPSEISNMVSATLDWQNELEVSAVMSPTVMVDDLGSQWAQIALMLAQESVNQHTADKPLLISLVVGEEALRQRASVDEWLNNITTLDVNGFYLIVKRASGSYSQHYEPEVLASLLRVCYSLSEINQYRLVVGYTDISGILLHAVGVSATATGWTLGLRQFGLRRFQPVSGGRRPRSRYSSGPLLNSIYISELDGIYNAGYVAEVLSDTQYDSRFNGTVNPENVPWPTSEASLHHWNVLADVTQSVSGIPVGERLDSVRDLIAQARAVYNQMGNLVAFSSETGPTHLDQWLDALNRFRSDTSV